MILQAPIAHEIPTMKPAVVHYQDSQHELWNRIPPWIRRLAQCVRQHESHHNYRAENPHSTASGAYQFLAGTWTGNAQWAKYHGRYVARRYVTAGDAPRWIQDLVFTHSIQNGGVLNWRGTHCGYGT